jgi:hypothetical protein
MDIETPKLTPGTGSAALSAALHGQLRTRHEHVATAAKLNVELRKARGQVHGFNNSVAVIVPAVLGSMAFFWICVVLALCSLPAVTTAVDTELHLGIGLASFFPSFLIKASLIALVSWIAQTFIQLVALPVLQVSNNAQMALVEEHTAVILDRLDTDTAGGLQIVLEAIHALQAKVDAAGRGASDSGSH